MSEESVVEIKRGTNAATWREIHRASSFYAAEQWMMKNPQDKATRARKLDGSLTSYLPFGPMDKSEFA